MDPSMNNTNEPTEKNPIEKSNEIFELVYYYLYEFPQNAYNTWIEVQERYKKNLADRLAHLKKEKANLENRIEQSWTDFIKTIKDKSYVELTEKGCSALDSNISDYKQKMAVFFEEKNKIERKIAYLAQADFQKVLNGNIIFDMFGEMKKKVSDKINEQANEIIDKYEKPFSGATLADDGKEKYTSKPVVKTCNDDCEYLGYETITIKRPNSETNDVIFAPVVADRNHLLILNYQSDDNPTTNEAREANRKAYETVSLCIANICFQEMCRNIGERDFKIHYWSAADDGRINITETLEYIYFLQNNTGKVFIDDKEKDPRRELENWKTRKKNDPDDPFEIVLIFYNPNVMKNEDIASFAQLRSRNVFTIVICRNQDFFCLDKELSEYDHATLVHSDNTTSFTSEIVYFGKGGVTERNILCYPFDNAEQNTFFNKDHLEMKLPDRMLQIKPLVSCTENNKNFLSYSIRMLINPPCELPPGTVEVPIGTINGYPICWTYSGAGIAQNAFVYGMTGSGKTVWLKDAVFYLANHYTKEQVNIYLCTFNEKGMDDFSYLCETIPHIVLSVISQTPAKIQILMNKLRKEEQKRGRLFESLRNKLKELGVADASIENIDDYRRYKRQYKISESEFEDIPTIILFLDEVSKLTESYSKKFSVLYDQFFALTRTMRSKGMFYIMLSQQSRDLDSRMQGMLENFLQLEGTRRGNINTIHKTYYKINAGEIKSTISLENVIADMSSEGINRFKAQQAEKLKKFRDQKASSNNMFFENSENCFLSLETTPIIRDTFRETVKSTTNLSLSIYGGISYGHPAVSENDRLITCYSDPFFFTFQKESKRPSKNILVLGEIDETTDAYWVQTINSIMAQQEAKCRIIFCNELTNKDSIIPSDCSEISYPEDKQELQKETNLWIDQAKGKETGYDFTILVLNLDKLKELFEEEEEEQQADESPEAKRRARMRAIIEAAKKNNVTYEVKTSEMDFKRSAPPPEKTEAKKETINLKTFDGFNQSLRMLIENNKSQRNGAYVFFQTDNPSGNGFIDPYEGKDFWQSRFSYFVFNIRHQISNSLFSIFSDIQVDKNIWTGFYYADSTLTASAPEMFQPISPAAAFEVAKQDD